MLHTETYDLREERDRLDSELDDLAEQSVDLEDRASDLQGRATDLEDGDSGVQEIKSEYGRLMEQQEELQEDISDASSQLNGIEWVIEEHGGDGGADHSSTSAEGESIPNSVDPDASPSDHAETDGGQSAPTITVGGLTAGEYAQVTDKVGTAQSETMGFGGGQASVEGASQIFYCASGLVNAPFLDGDGRTMSLDAKCEAVREVAPGLLQWLEAKITDLTMPSEAAGNDFAARREQARENRT